MRYAGIKNNNISIISDSLIKSDTLEVVEIPSEFSSIDTLDLLTNYKYKNGKFLSKNFRKPAKNMKVAFVGNWKMKCGISTYSENLWPHAIKFLGDYQLFVEANDNPTGPLNEMGGEIIPSDKINVCWKRGDSLKNLIAEIKNYDPDVISLQHEFGIWPNAAYWMSMLTQLSDYRIIVTMHSIFPNHKDKTIVEACIPEIIVHLDGAKDALVKKGISGKIHVLPHGCYEHSKEKFWNFYKTKHTIIQIGFGHQYKSFEDTILACSLIKETYSDIFLTIIFSESDNNKHEHQMYYNTLIDLIETLHLEENVAIVRGFQHDESINSYLRTNRVSIFPYKSIPEHFVYGSSGAARLAMAANIPVISSNIPHFSDLPTIKCDTPNEIAVVLDKLFSNNIYYSEQVEKQNIFIEDNNWDNVAVKFIEILEK